MGYAQAPSDNIMGGALLTLMRGQYLPRNGVATAAQLVNAVQEGMLIHQEGSHIH